MTTFLPPASSGRGYVWAGARMPMALAPYQGRLLADAVSSAECQQAESAGTGIGSALSCASLVLRPIPN
jgi:hypothetical protein